MKLSCIVPVYNVEKYLRQCVESILSQTFDDYEIILVDDGSPDSCPKMCDDFKSAYPDVIKVVHKENGGLASARNAGLDVARGEYIFFIDSDDYLGSDSMNELYKKAVEFDADVLQTTYISVKEDGTEIYHSPLRFDKETVYSKSDMQYEICFSNKKNRVIFVWRNLFKRDMLNKYNIRFEESLRMIEDAPFNTLALLKSERFVAVDIPVYRYRYRDDSLQRQKYVKDYDKILELQRDIKLKYYTENCTPQKEFYEDLAEHTVKNMFPLLISNLYKNKVEDRYSVLKRIGNSEMMRRSFKDYDINEFKSKSLDWWMTWCMKYRLYPLANLICEKVLYK